MHKDIKNILVSEEKLANISKELGKKISEDFKDKTPIFIGLLKGCNPFLSDLLKNITIPCEVDYMRVSSYIGTESKGSITIVNDITTNVKGRDVIIVDDIVDTGRTTSLIKNLFEQRDAKSVTLCCMLDKTEGRVVDVDVKYIGTNVPNEFVVGYGLDYNELYRNLPYIGVLKEKVYNK